nr:phage minor capsid protein [Ruminococcus bromii]
MSDYDIGKAFEEIENELIDSMMRNFSRHRAEETKEGYNWTQWQAEQLKNLEEYRRKNAKKFGKRFKSINSKVEEMIRTAKADGSSDQEAEILETVKNGFKPPEKPSEHSTGEFFKVNERKLDALVKSTTDDLKRAETAVLRMSNDKYRKAIYNAQVAMNTGAVTYEQAVDIACKDMLNAGLNCVEYKNGARHTLSDYADMAVKTANKRAYLRGEGEKRAEWGVSLVVVNSRQGGCPDCAKYIGKVFIDDVYSNGKKSDGNYPLLSTAIKNGLFHPRCKDSTSTYYEEITTLEPVSPEEEAEMDRRERLEEKQQYAQRQAERFDRRAEYSLDEDNKRIAQTRADEWHDRADMLEEKAKQFSLKTDEQKYYRPVFKEDISKTFERKIEGETITIDTRKANTLCDNVYISDKVKLKRKELHDFDMQVRKAFDMLGEVETSGKPDICIISPEEMRVNAIASYMPMQNVLNVNSAYFSTSDLSDLQENLACPQDGLSTILHELIHWQDAKSYRAKFGGINDYFEYCDYLNKIYAPKVEKLINNGYNIEDISEYAFECLKDKAMDEVYNEYRVSKLLG